MKILILTSSAGNGHNSAAKRISEKFMSENSENEIEIIDVYKSYASKLKAFIMEKGYFLACNHALKIYNACFKRQEKLNFSKQNKFHAHKSTYCFLPGVLNKINSFQPDLIVCTYIYTAIGITNLKRVYNIPAKVACMTLDYGISPYWECVPKGLDYMFLTDESMVEPFIQRGFKKEQLFVTGIPISNSFEINRNKEETRKSLGLDKSLFTICVMKASFFPVSEKALIKNLMNVEEKIQVVIINGKSEKSKKKIDKYIKKYKIKHKIINLGFTNQVPEYFASSDLILGKAGGLTVTETLSSAKPSLIVDKLPQQEIYNKKFLIDNKCAISVNKKNISKNINKLLKNKTEYDILQKNALNTRKLNAVSNIYNILKDIPKANYSNIIYDLNKKIIIKKINKQRKKDIKTGK